MNKVVSQLQDYIGTFRCYRNFLLNILSISSVSGCSHPVRKSPSVWGKKSPKWVGVGGIMSDSKLLLEPFVVVCVWKFLMNGGDLIKIQDFEELFCLNLDFF